MTTNTNAAVATSETTNNVATDAANDAKQKRTTLISALLEGNADSVAEVLLKQGRTLEEIKAFADTFKKAVPSFKTQHAQREEQLKQEEIRKQEARAAEEAAQAAAATLLETARKVAIDNMVKDLEKQGISPEMALKFATQSLGGGSSTRGSTAPKVRIKCVYNGKEYLVAKTGNNKDATKAAIAESGLDRDAFIEKYKAE